MSGSLDITVNGKLNTYNVTPSFTKPLLDGQKPVADEGCTDAGIGAQECSFLFQVTAGARPKKLTGGLTLSGPATLRSDAAAPATASHTEPITITIPSV